MTTKDYSKKMSNEGMSETKPKPPKQKPLGKKKIALQQTKEGDTSTTLLLENDVSCLLN